MRSNILHLPKKHKFNAVPVKEDGKYFDSTLEFNYFNHLKLLQKTGKVSFFLRQVPFELDLKNTKISKYFVDFQVFYTNGAIEFVDVKGKETVVFKMKKKMVEALYPITITIIKKEDFMRGK